jgi:spore coat protein U-like protein
LSIWGLFSARIRAAICAGLLACLFAAVPAGAQTVPEGQCQVNPSTGLTPLYQIEGLPILQDTWLGTAPAGQSFTITCGATNVPIDISITSTGNGSATGPGGTLLYKLCPGSSLTSCPSPFFGQFPGGLTWKTIDPGAGDVTVAFDFVPVLSAQPAPGVSNAPYTDTLMVTWTGPGAGSVPVPFQVQAISACIFGSTPKAPDPTYKLQFGVGNGTQTDETTAAGVLQITCSAGAEYNITANEGANFENGTRRMRLNSPTPAADCTGAGDCLDYKLLMTPAGASNQEWGGTPITPAGAAAIEGQASGATQAIPFYGLVPEGQPLQAGTYKDTVQLTITVDP